MVREGLRSIINPLENLFFQILKKLIGYWYCLLLPIGLHIGLYWYCMSGEPAWFWLGGPRVLGRTGLVLAWGAKGPGPGRLGS